MPTPTNPTPHSALSPARSIALQRSISAAVAAFAALSLADTTERAEAQQVIYVDDDAPPGGDGTSWETAFQAIYEGGVVLSGSAAFKDVEVRVAGGHYFVTDPIGGSSADTLVLQSGVVFRGGFRGLAGGGDPNEQNPSEFASIIDGDIGTPGIMADNTAAAMFAADGTDVFIDGFSVTNMRTRAMWVGSSVRADIRRCHFESGQGAQQDMIRARFGSQLSIDDCEFRDVDVMAAAVFSNARTTTIARCRFIGVTSRVNVVSATFSDTVTLSECTFDDSLVQDGSALFAGNCDVVLMDGVIVQHTRTLAEGGYSPIHVRDAESLHMANCLMLDNDTRPNEGGAISIGRVNLTVVDRCAFAWNRSARYSGAIDHQGGPIEIHNSLFWRNSASLSVAAISSADMLMLRSCTVAENSSGGSGGIAVFAAPSKTPSVENCVIWNNTASGSPPSLGSQIPNSLQPFIRSSIVTGIPHTQGNLSLDPLFLAPGDYRLAPDSPAIGLGHNPLADPLNTTTDLDGNPRVRGPFLDAGCYEAPADAACSPADLAGVAIRGLPGYRRSDDRLSSDDFFVFLEAYTLADNAADLTTTATPGAPGFGIPNGVLNTDDFLYYLALYAAGC